jgi:hypothetical protein
MADAIPSDRSLTQRRVSSASTDRLAEVDTTTTGKLMWGAMAITARERSPNGARLSDSAPGQARPSADLTDGRIPDEQGKRQSTLSLPT